VGWLGLRPKEEKGGSWWSWSLELLRAGGKEWEREEWACAAKKEGRSGPAVAGREEGGS